MHPQCNGLRWQQQQQIGLPSYVPSVSKRTCRPLKKALAVSINQGPSKAVHDGRMPWWKTLEQYIRPRKYTDKVLDNHAFAWGKTGIPPQDALVIGDLEAVRSIGASEMQLGVRANFPPTFGAMLGATSIAMTDDLNLHACLRQIISISFTKESIQALLPQLQQKAAMHLARWAAATSTGSNGSGSISGNGINGSRAALPAHLPTTADGSMILGYPAVRLLTFDVLVNCVLGLQMSDQEVQQYELLFKDLINGFMPPMLDLPFTPYGKGLKAREQVVARVKHTLSGSNCSGALARMREVFGDDNPVTIDNTINLLFAGFDTTSSSLSYMMFLLAQHPEVLAKVQAEQAAVLAKHGPTLTPGAYADMPYSMAVIKETLRLAQIIPNVPRIATKELQVPGGPTLPAGCPFFAAFEAIGRSDPALQKSKDGEQFKPERWLDPAAVKTLSQYQLPFGTGQRTCLGINLAYAEMASVLAELSRNYSFAVDVDTEWNDMPIKNPVNGLPLRLTRNTKAEVLQAEQAMAMAAAAR